MKENDDENELSAVNYSNAFKIALLNKYDLHQDISYPIIDSHCHLQLEKIYPFVDQVIELASQYNISHAVVCGTCPGDDWERIHKLSQNYPLYILPSYGLHPWWILGYLKSLEIQTSSSSISSITTSLTNELESVLISNPKANIGECGLDKTIIKDISLENQLNIFDVHFTLACKFNRTITIHCISGYYIHLLTYLQNKYPSKKKINQENGLYPRAIVLHSCNTLPHDLILKFLKLPNIYFSFSGRLLNEKVFCLFKTIPLDRILLETDSPDQISLTFGKELHYNEPVLLRFQYSAFAEWSRISLNDLLQNTYKNAVQAFNIDI